MNILSGIVTGLILGLISGAVMFILLFLLAVIKRRNGEDSVPQVTFVVSVISSIIGGIALGITEGNDTAYIIATAIAFFVVSIIAKIIGAAEYPFSFIIVMTILCLVINFAAAYFLNQWLFAG